MNLLLWIERALLALVLCHGCCHITWYIAFGMCHVGCNDTPHGHVVCFLFMWYVFFLQNHRILQLMIFKGQKWLKPWHKRKNKVWLVHRVILHLLGAKLHHTGPLVLCATARQLTCVHTSMAQHTTLWVLS